jgi:hypothetical protein
MEQDASRSPKFPEQEIEKKYTSSRKPRFFQSDQNKKTKGDYCCFATRFPAVPHNTISTKDDIMS